MAQDETLTIRTERDPTVLLRIAAPIAVDNTIPDSLSAALGPDGEMLITMMLRGASSERLDYLATRIECAIPTVIKVGCL